MRNSRFGQLRWNIYVEIEGGHEGGLCQAMPFDIPYTSWYDKIIDCASTF